ncbi:MAG TPA: MSHA biogenesis protein MshK [Burkholderiales bacterium]|nr:MSHA biogenesis protein MshK [Burkholderiales bacterium]
MMRPTFAMATLVLATIAGSAAANSYTDPTRPPMEAASASRGGTVAPSEPIGPVLQSTMVSPYRKSAVISGKKVKIGDSYEGSVIVDIAPYEVRMTRGGREISLRLAPKLTTDKGRVE